MSDSRIRVTTWFAGSDQHRKVEIEREDLSVYLGTLRTLKRYSEALRVAVNDLEVDLGRSTHVW